MIKCAFNPLSVSTKIGGVLAFRKTPLNKLSDISEEVSQALVEADDLARGMTSLSENMTLLDVQAAKAKYSSEKMFDPSGEFGGLMASISELTKTIWERRSSMPNLSATVLDVNTFTKNVAISFLSKMEERLTPNNITSSVTSDKEVTQEPTENTSLNSHDIAQLEPESESLNDYLTALEEEHASTLNGGDLTISEFSDVYFAENSSLLSGEFIPFLMEKISNNVLELRKSKSKNHNYNIFSPDGKSVNLKKVLDQTRAELAASVKNNAALLDGDVSALKDGEKGRTGREALYAKIAHSKFNNLMKLLLADIIEVRNEDLGLAKNKKSSQISNYDGGRNGFDSVSKLVNLHIETTKRLKLVEGTDNEFVLDPLNGSKVLNRGAVKQALGALQFFNSSTDFGKNLLATAETLASTDYNVSVILRSIYQKFFATETYRVNGVEYYSVKQLMDNSTNKIEKAKLRDLLMAITADLTSLYAPDSLSTGTRTRENVSSRAAKKEALKENVNNRISDSGGSRGLNNRSKNNFKINENTETGEVQLFVNNRHGISYKVSSDSGKGFIIEVKEDDVKKLASTDTAEGILKSIFGQTWPAKDFLNYHNSLFVGQSPDVKERSLANIVANLSYAIAINDATYRDIADEASSLFTGSYKEKSSGLAYPPLDFAWGPANIINDFIQARQDADTIESRYNSDGNRVANVADKNRIVQLPSIVNEVRKLGNTNKFSPYRNNQLVSQTNFKLEKVVEKDGLTEGAVTIGNKKLSLEDRFKLEIEKYFLGMAVSSGFQKTAIQLFAAADRTNPPVLLIKNTRANSLILSPNFKANIPGKNYTQLQEIWMKNFKQSHEDFAESIVNNWKNALSEFADKGIITKEDFSSLFGTDGNNIVDINDLSKKLIELNIPFEIVKSSPHIQFGKDYSQKNGRIKEVFLYAYNMRDNTSDLLSLLKREFRKFKSDLGKFNKDSLSKESYEQLSQIFSKPATNKDALFNLLLENYFYISNIIAVDASNLLNGSIYEFKGDIDSSKVRNTIEFRSYRNYQRNEIKKNEKNKDLTEEEINALVDEATNKYIKDTEFSLALSELFIDQSKRNAAPGSSGRFPVLLKPDEKGEGLDQEINVLTVEDPTDKVDLLGKLGMTGAFDIFDAGVPAHPLNFIFTAKSLGDSHSPYGLHNSMNISGRKDIDEMVDYEKGGFRLEKKLTINSFSNEALKRSVLLQRIFYKMNTAIPFEGGLNHEGKTYNNMLELWLSRGGMNNDNSWLEVAEILAEHPQFRNNYISKLAMPSSLKVAKSGINTWESLLEEDKPVEITKISNKGTRVILNMDHDPDASKERSKSFMTQMQASLILEGNSADDVFNINDAIGNLTFTGASVIEDDIELIALTLMLEEKSPSKELKQLLLNYPSGFLTNASRVDALKLAEEEGYIKKATKEWARKVSEIANSKRDLTGTAVTHLLKKEVASMESLQLLQLVHSSISAEFNKRTVKIKYTGGEYSASISHDLLPLYTLPNGNQVDRETYLKTISARKVNSVEELSSIAEFDEVIYGGQKMMYFEAKKIAREKGVDLLSTPLVAKIAKTQPNTLKWMNYTINYNGAEVGLDAVGADGNYIVKEYADLKSNGEALSRAANTRKKLKIDLRSPQTSSSDKSVISSEINTLSAEMKKLRVERARLKKELQELLVNNHVSTSDSEFYIPAIHLSAYNLDRADGNPDSSINISDIMGWHNSTDPGETFYVLNGNRVSKDVEGAIPVTEAEFNSMVEFFKGRIKLHILKPGIRKALRITAATRFDANKTVEANIENWSLELEKLIDARTKSSGLKAGHIDQAVTIYSEALANLKAMLPRMGTTEAQMNVINTFLEKVKPAKVKLREGLIESMAINQAYSFPQTLSFIAGRIPGQGKQSATAAKAKGFIHSQRNSVFGPIHMLVVTGADHDGDKVHIMAFCVDPETGVVYDYLPLMEDGSISARKVKAVIDRAVEEYLALNPDATLEDVYRIKRNKKEEIIGAIQNFVVAKILKVLRDPANAIESATPISMDTIDEQVAEITSQVFLEEDGEGEDKMVSIKKQTVMSPFNPASKLVSEDQNAAAGNGIGIFATAIKGYSVSFTSALKRIKEGDVNKVKFASEATILSRLFPPKSGVTPEMIEEALNGIQEELGINVEGLNLYKLEDGKLKASSRQSLANLDKWIEDNITSEEEAAEIMQAWEALSELLSAATDNAKDPKLGAMGANDHTSPLIAAAVVAGFSFEDILNILKEPSVRKIISKVKAHNDLGSSDQEADAWFYKNLKLALAYGPSSQGTKEELEKLKVAKANLAQVRRRESSKRATLSNDVVLEPIKSVKSNVDQAGWSKVKFDKLNSTIDAAEITRLRDNSTYVADNDPETLQNYIDIIKDSDVIIMPYSPNSTSFSKIRKYALAKGKEVYGLAKDGSIISSSGAGVSGEILPSDYIPSLSGKSIGILSVDANGLLDDKMGGVSHIDIINNIIAKNNEVGFTATDSPQTKLDKIAKANKLVDNYNKTIDNAIATAESNYTNLASSILGNQPRQLAKLLALSEEFSLVTAFANINQGLKGGQFEAFSFLLESIPAGSRKDIKKFIKLASSNLPEEVAEAQKIADKYEEEKLMVNPLQILMDNPNFLSFISMAVRVDEVYSESTEVGDFLQNLQEQLGVSDKDTFKELVSFMYGSFIDKFFNIDANRIYNLNGVKYDLSTPSGRYAFLAGVNSAVLDAQNSSAYKNNELLRNLTTDTIYDARTGNRWAVLKTPNLQGLSPVEHSAIQTGLYDLLKINPQLHDALYVYTLIIGKGALGSTSFSSLFKDTNKTPSFGAFTNFLKDSENLAKVKESILTDPDLSIIFKLNSPSSLPIRSFKRGMSVKGSSYKGPRIVKSKETGAIYILDEDLSKFIPLEFQYPIKGVSYSYSTIGSGIDKSGASKGITVKYPIAGENKEITLFYYDNLDQQYVDSKGNKLDTEQLKAENPDMVFDGFVFRKKTDTDYIEEPKYKSAPIRLSGELERQIIDGTQKYLIIEDEDLDEDQEFGSLLKRESILSSSNVRVAYEYIGEIDFSVDSELARSVRYNLGGDKRIVQGIRRGVGNRKVKVARIILKSTPSPYKYVSANESTYRFYQSIFNKRAALNSKAVLNRETNKLVLSPSKSISSYEWDSFNKELDKKGSMIIRLTKDSYFKISRSTDKASRDKEGVIRVSEDRLKSAIVLNVTPFNPKAENNNSFTEQQFLPDLNDISPDFINGFELITPDNPNGNLELEGIDISTKSDVDFYNADAFAKATEDFKIITASSSLNESVSKRQAAAIDGAEMVVISDAIYRTSAEGRGTRLDNKGSKAARLIEWVESRSDEDAVPVKDILKTLKEDGNIRGGVYNELAKDLKLDSESELLKVIAEAQALYDSEKLIKEDVILSFKLGKAAFAGQYAKLSGKPLFVYNNEKSQWYSYDQETGQFNPTRTPVLDGKVAYIDPSEESKGLTTPLREALIKTGEVRRRSTEAVGSLKRPNVFNLGISLDNSEDPINEVKSSGEVLFSQDGALSPTSVKVNMADKLINFTEKYGSNQSQKPAIKVDGKLITRESFIEFSDYTLEELGDGTVLIISKSNDKQFNWVYFPDKSKQKEYGGFRGDAIKENFPVKFKLSDGSYRNLVFDELHRVDSLSEFYSRNQLLEERGELSKAWDTIEKLYKGEINRLVSTIRNNSGQEVKEMLRDYSYKDLVLHLSRNASLIPGREAEVMELLQLNVKLNELKSKALKQEAELISKYSGGLVGSNNYNGTFGELKNKGAFKNGEGTIVYFDLPGDSGMTTDYKAIKNSRALRLFNPDVVKGLSFNYSLKNQFESLIETARKETNKKFYVQLPTSDFKLGSSTISHNRMLMNIGKAVFGLSFPSNILFIDNGGKILTEYYGGVNPQDINRSSTYLYTTDPLVEDTFNLNLRHSPYKLEVEYKGKKKSIMDHYVDERGLSMNSDGSYPKITDSATIGSAAFNREKEVLEKLYELWAESNPGEFKRLAAQIKGKIIYEDNKFAGKLSGGAILSKLLTQKFSNNDWVLSGSVVELKGVSLKEDQTLISMGDVFKGAGIDVSKMSANERGKARYEIFKDFANPRRIKIGDETYIATPLSTIEIGDKIPNWVFEGLGINSISEIDDDALESERLSLVRLSKFDRNVEEIAEVAVGDFADRIKSFKESVEQEEADLIDAEMELMASMATAIYSFDAKSTVLETSLSGTNRIQALRKATGTGVVIEPTSETVAYINGSKLEDNVNAQKIKSMFWSNKAIVDKLMKAGATIIVGKNTGLDEQVKSYVLSNDNYSLREDERGFVYLEHGTPYKAQPHSKYVTVSNGNGARINANNNGNRVTGLFQGPKATEDGTDFLLSLDPKNVRNSADTVDAELVNSLISNLGITVSDKTSFDDDRANLLKGEILFIKNLVAYSLALESGKIKPDSFKTQKELSSKLSSLLESDSDFLNRYNEVLSKLLVDGSKIKGSDTKSLIIAKSRKATLRFVEESTEGLVNDNILNSKGFKLLNEERSKLEKTSNFRKYNISGISNSELSLISSGDASIEEMYEYLMLSMKNKTFHSNGNIDAQPVNRAFVKSGIKGISTSDRSTVVLDNDLLRGVRGKEETLTKEKVDKELVDIRRDFARGREKMFAYLDHHNLIDFDEINNEITVTVGTETEVFEANDEGYKKANSFARAALKFKLFKDLKGLNINTIDTAKNLKIDGRTNTPILSLMLKYKISPNKPVMDLIFRAGMDTSSLNELTTAKKITSGNMYKYGSELVFMIEDPYLGTFKGITESGNIISKNISGEWEIGSESNTPAVVISDEVVVNDSFADDSRDGEVYSLLRSTDGIISSNKGFQVSIERVGNNKIVIAKDRDGKSTYTWDKSKRVWSYDSDANIVFTPQSAQVSILPGQSVFSLNTPLGVIALKNGKAISEDLVEDIKGTYKRNPDTGIWSIDGVKPLFNNPKVKFQKESVVFKDESGKELASRKVSPTVLRRVFKAVFKKSNIPAKIYSDADISAIYGKQYAGKPGFTFTDGTIVINIDHATLDTMLHEYGGHIYLAHLKNTDRMAYDLIISKALQSDLAEKLRKGAYKELNDIELGDEVFSTLFGLVNQDKLTDKKQLNLWNKITKIAEESTSILDFFKNLFNSVFGIKTGSKELDIDFKKDSLMTIISKLGDDLIFNEDSALHNLSSYDMDNIKKALNPEVKEDAIKEKLEKLGLIKTICN